MRMGSWVFLWTCLQPNESAFCRLFCPKNGSSSKVLFNRPPKTKQLLIRQSGLKCFYFGSFVIQIASGTIKTHECLIVCIAEIMPLIAVLKLHFFPIAKMMQEKKDLSFSLSIIHKMYWCFNVLLSLLIFDSHYQSVGSIPGHLLHQTRLISEFWFIWWFILQTETLMKELKVLPSPHRIDYTRQNMKQSVGIGSHSLCK